MAFFSEYDSIPETSTHFTSLDEINNVIDFMFDELVGSGHVLEELEASGEDWLNNDKACVYFELEAAPGYNCNVSARGMAREGRYCVFMSFGVLSVVANLLTDVGSLNTGSGCCYSCCSASLVYR